LHWALQRLPSLQKRAYLAKYLVPEAIPQEFMQDDVLVELHGSHKALQAEFKEVPI
jgi:intraflagellar transport protein 81